MTDDSALKYSPFSSHVDPSFWHKLSQIKLDIDKLDEKVHPVWGSYTNVNAVGLPSLHVDCTSYNRCATLLGCLVIDILTEF